MRKADDGARAYDEMHTFLRNIKAGDPTISEADAREQLWQTLQAQRTRYFRLLYNNWFDVNWLRYRAVVVKKGSVTVIKDENRKRTTDRAVAVARGADELKHMVLMDLLMPNGRPLRDCTGAECTWFGGWLADVGKAISPGQKVGKQLSEMDLQNLYGRNQPRNVA